MRKFVPGVSLTRWIGASKIDALNQLGLCHGHELGCHWLCQCSLNAAFLSPYTGRARGKQPENQAATKRCGVRENVLYRSWPNKRAMFLAAVEYFYTVTVDAWTCDDVAVSRERHENRASL